MSTGTWICGDCRSANGPKQTRCYKCRVPRATSELTEQAAAIPAVQGRVSQTISAKVDRLGARYRPSWPLALLIVPTILIATGLSVAWTNELVAGLGPGGVYLNEPETSQGLDLIGMAMLVALVAGWLAWSAWSAVVVSNVPALTARYPAHSPIGAFFAQIRWRGGYRVMWGVLAILAGERAGPRLIVRLWWSTLLLAYFLPGLMVLLRGPATFYAALVLALQVRLVLLGIAAILAIVIVVIVEREQRRALGRRTATIVGDRYLLT